MNVGKRFLLLSLGGEQYALPITRLLEITVRRDIQRDPNLSEIFEGKTAYRGKMVPVLNVKKLFNIAGDRGNALLIVQSTKGTLGLLVDAVAEIMDAEQEPVPMPRGVVNPDLPYYAGVVRHKENIVLLLNEDGLLP